MTIAPACYNVRQATNCGQRYFDPNFRLAKLTVQVVQKRRADRFSAMTEKSGDGRRLHRASARGKVEPLRAISTHERARLVAVSAFDDDLHNADIIVQ